MRFRPPLPSVVLSLTFLGWAGLAVVQARAADKPNPPPPGSDHATAEASTNTAPFSRKLDLRQIEEEISRSFRPAAPRGPLDGVSAPQYNPPPPQPAPNRRAQEQFVRRKNWMQLTPEETEVLMMTPGSFLNTRSQGQDSLSGKDTRDPNLSDLERQLGINPGLWREIELLGPRSKAAGPKESTSREQPTMPGELKDSSEKLKNFLEAERVYGSGAGAGRSSFADFFGLAQPESSPEQVRARKAYLQEYQKWLNQPAAGTVVNPLNLPDAKAQTGAPGPGKYAPARSGGAVASTPGFNHSIPDPTATALRDPNETVLNQWNPMYIPPKIEPPKPTPPPPPITEAPRRKFQ